jgi:hypothetical protein
MNSSIQKAARCGVLSQSIKQEIATFLERKAANTTLFNSLLRNQSSTGGVLPLSCKREISNFIQRQHANKALFDSLDQQQRGVLTMYWKREIATFMERKEGNTALYTSLSDNVATAPRIETVERAATHSPQYVLSDHDRQEIARFLAAIINVSRPIQS